jgi:outer membrane protein assembly factor BamB
MESAPAPRKNRRQWFMLAGLIVLVLYLFVFQPYWKERERSESDPDLVEKLRAATIVPAAPEPTGTDWPQWRGVQRDGHSAEKGLLTTWPAEGPPLVWKVAGGAGHSSMAVVQGRLFTLLQDGQDEVVVCLDTATGKDVWRQRYPGRFHEQYAGEGPHATPTVVDGRVYTVGGKGMFHCFDAATGDVLWKHNLPEEFSAPSPYYGTSFSPLVVGDLVYTLPGGGDGNSMAAFHRVTGKLVWKAFDDPCGYSSPVAATIGGKRQIVFLTGTNVMGVTPEAGKLLWQYEWKTHQECNIATPIVIGPYVFVSAGYGKGCGLLEISTDAAGTLTPRRVYAHNRMRNHLSTCVVYQDHLYGFDTSTRMETLLVCMELRTGKVCWKHDGFDRGSLIVADGRLIVLGQAGRLGIVDPDPKEYRELTAATISDSRCWAMPALVQGKLYVRDQQHIMCFDLSAKK